MNKIISGALLSAGIALTTTAQSSEFGAAFANGAILDAVMGDKKTVNKSVQSPQSKPSEEKLNKKTQYVKNKTKNNVIQIVGLQSIPTTLGAISEKKWYDCRVYQDTKYYFSYQKEKVAEDIFFNITPEIKQKMLQLPKCKK